MGQVAEWAEGHKGDYREAWAPEPLDFEGVRKERELRGAVFFFLRAPKSPIYLLCSYLGKCTDAASGLLFRVVDLELNFVEQDVGAISCTHPFMHSSKQLAFGQFSFKRLLKHLLYTGHCARRAHGECGYDQSVIEL